MFGRKDKGLGRIDTLIAQSSRLQGDIDFSGGLHLDGRVNGNIRAEVGAQATLWISEKAQVEGNIDVPNMIVNGLVKGDISARDRVVFGTKARVLGNVSYGRMEMTQGAEIVGKLCPLNQPAAAPMMGNAPVALKAVK